MSLKCFLSSQGFPASETILLLLARWMGQITSKGHRDEKQPLECLAEARPEFPCWNTLFPLRKYPWEMSLSPARPVGATIYTDTASSTVFERICISMELKKKESSWVVSKLPNKYLLCDCFLQSTLPGAEKSNK